MADPVSGIAHTQQSAQIQAAQNAQNKQPQPPQNAPKPAAPEDTVTISSQGRAASQAQVKQTQQATNDGDQDGK